VCVYKAGAIVYCAQKL